MVRRSTGISQTAVIRRHQRWRARDCARWLRRFERRRHSVARAFIPLSFSPGEAYQFDFSHEHVEIGGIEQVVKVAHIPLCHSRASFLVGDSTGEMHSSPSTQSLCPKKRSHLNQQLACYTLKMRPSWRESLRRSPPNLSSLGDSIPGMNRVNRWHQA